MAILKNNVFGPIATKGLTFRIIFKMSRETSNSNSANVNVASQFHGSVHIHAENLHLGLGDVKQGQKALTSEKPLQNKDEEEKAEVSRSYD